MNKDKLTEQMYIGDGVYAGFDGFHVWLYTDDGLQITNQIALEPEVLLQFLKWTERIPTSI